MEHIILEAQDPNRIDFELAGLTACLNQLTDSRKRRGKVYPLGVVLTLIFLAKLAGEDKPSGIAQWIRLRCDAFVRLFNLKHQRMPCLNTIRGILQEVISLEELEKKVNQYLFTTYGGGQSQLIAMDGKTMRGTIPKGGQQGIHLLTAYLPEEGVVLKQVEVSAATNEITTAPKLMQALDLKRKVVCGDAMQTQRDLSVEVLAAGGDYIWFLKENQPTVRADVEQFFNSPRVSAGWHRPSIARTTSRQINKGHGRLERRSLTLLADEEEFLDWPGVRQVFQLERKVIHLRTVKTTTDVVYGITSCEAHKASARQMLTWTRQYWGIENGLHYRRDVTLREDATRISHPRLAKAMAIINNFIVTLSQKLGYANLAEARRIFDARIAAQLV